MSKLKQRYNTNLALLTDLYQLCMAYGYWKTGRAEEEAVFYLFYRKNPFGGKYSLAAGLEDVIDFLEQFTFDKSDIEFLATIKGADQQPLFEKAFLDYLLELQFSCDVDAVEEGTIVFANEPLIRITGPLLQGQLIETPLLNFVNFQTLIATKAARMVKIAKGDAILELGLRRAQGIDGGLSASRAAYIGGCHATSNLLASKIYGIPATGTVAHSWVMSFEDEEASFMAYANCLPNNCVLVVDTYDSLKGVKKAIKIGKKLRKKGHDLLGIRLDSGNMLTLSQKARKLLDKAGFENTSIIGSDSLDETTIKNLKAAGAAITIWGVGTHLVTAYDQPALGAVYKLAAIRNDKKDWTYKIKLSDNPNKVSTPGLLQIRRYSMSDGNPFGDMIWNIAQEEPIPHFQSFDGRDIVASDRNYTDLLKPIFRKGQLRYKRPQLVDIRQKCIAQVKQFEQVDFDYYPIGLEQNLNKLKLALIKKNR